MATSAEINSGPNIYNIDTHPRLDFTRIIGNAKPTEVTRGVIVGFSLPIYNSDDEELYLVSDVADTYSEAQDLITHIHCYIDTANNAKKFKLQLEWEHYTVGVDIIPATANAVTVETTTGNDSQYMSYEVDFTIDYDIDGGDTIVAADEIHFRLRRIAASANEITGEVVITEIGLIFPSDRLGN